MTAADDSVTIKSTGDLWDEIGFHKPIAGFWYKIIYQFIGIGVSAVVMGYLINYFYPYPESFGYKDVVVNLFNLMFLLFDVGTASVMGRFIPEANIKNPEKMLHYIQYFIWYQMMTGLVQVTVITIYSLFFATQTALAYLVWLMLLRSTIQYPGFLAVFQNVLGALQQFDKREIIYFLNGAVIQRLTELAFVWMGRMYGMANPEVGEILGIAIGASIGLYIDDFGTMFIAAYFFSGAVEKYGIKPKHCFRRDFTWDEIKPVLIFSLKTQIPSVINSSIDFIMLQMWLTLVPQYTTIVPLAYIGGSIANTINWFNTPDITPLVSEAYMNDKKQLVQYYIGQVYRFVVLVQGLFIPLIITLEAIMDVVWFEFGMIAYLPGIVFIIPRLVRLCTEHYLKYPGQVLNGADKPELPIITSVLGKVISLGILWVLLAEVDVSTNFGLIGIAWTMEYFWLPVSIVLTLILVYYLNKKIVEIKIPWKQIFIGFAIPSLIALGLLQIIAYGVFFPIYRLWGLFPAIAIGILLIAMVLLFVYFPLTGYLGGWDETNLKEFKKVTKMSGPSKIIVIPLYNLIEKVCKKSKLHDKFKMPVEGVVKEANELLELKVNNREKLREKLRNEK